MPNCCRCNGSSGRCINCICARSGRKCDDCLPLRRGRCENADQTDQTPVDDQTRDEGNHSVPERNSTSDHRPSELSEPDPEVPPEHDPRSHPQDLPTFEKIGPPNYQWGNVDGETITQRINQAYNEIVHWRRNLFKVPSGKAGTQFVEELARLLTAYAEGTPLQNIAMKAVMTMPALLLQKPHPKSRTTDHSECLKKRFALWSKGDIESLLQEGKTIQLRLGRLQKPKGEGELARSFAKCLHVGNVKAAVKLITEEENSGSLPLSSMQPDGRSVKEHLLQKHPPRQAASADAISQDEPLPTPHPVMFDAIDGKMVRSISQKMTGSAGPSGMDSAGWRRACSSFAKASGELCTAVARVTKRLCSSYVDPEGITSLVACRLIALDKSPGVRPIGIGEVLRRIIGKAVLAITSEDICRSVGALQLCVGHISGCEAGVHAMKAINEDANTEAVLLIDASNAFNSLNREAALRNAHILCPAIAPILTNTYRDDPALFIDGETILSQEGTTQGDPLAMSMYAIGTLPLICRLPKEVNHVWFADDATAGGKVDDLRAWWDDIQDHGPQFGYIPNANKCWLIVKQSALQRAEDSFRGTGVNISVEGQKHLGAPLGTRNFAETFVRNKVQKWLNEVKCLSTIAKTQPQAAYAALTHGVMARWTYLMRLVPDIDELFQPLEDVIRYELLPEITGRHALSEDERKLIALPVRDGGLGIPIPTSNTTKEFEASSTITAPLVNLICNQQHDDEVGMTQKQLRSEVSRKRRLEQQDEALRLKQSLPSNLQRAMELASEKGASAWLTSLPIKEHGFTLHKQAFRDALCLRYGWKPLRLPAHCSCGAPFTTEHAFSCSKGAFPSIRHDRIRDITAQLLTETCHNVEVEPHLQALAGETFNERTANTEDNARLDVKAQGFWGSNREITFFDVRVFNPYASSNCSGTIAASYRRHEKEKRRAYERRVIEVEHASFTPIVLSTTGGWGPSASIVFKRLASMISEKHSSSYSSTMKMIRSKVAFSLIDSAIMCLRGARSSFHRPVKALNLIDNPIDLMVNEGQI